MIIIGPCLVDGLFIVNNYRSQLGSAAKRIKTVHTLVRFSFDSQADRKQPHLTTLIKHIIIERTDFRRTRDNFCNVTDMKTLYIVMLLSAILDHLHEIALSTNYY